MRMRVLAVLWWHSSYPSPTGLSQGAQHAFHVGLECEVFIYI